VFADFTDQQRAIRRRCLGGNVHCLLNNGQRSNAAPEVSKIEDGGLMAVGIAVLDFLFGCHHGELSRVFTVGGETYRVCFGCGAKFEYSIETMSIERRLPSAPMTGFRLASNGNATNTSRAIETQACLR
jgi:hypothetical protein